MIQPPWPSRWPEYHLTLAEQAILGVFLARPGVLTKDFVLAKLNAFTGRESDLDSATMIIYRIRNKLPDRRWIQSVRGVGFRLTDEGRAALSAETEGKPPT